MIHERGKNALIQDYTWDKSTGREEWRKCNMLLVHRGIRIIRVEAPTSGDQSGQGLGF